MPRTKGNNDTKKEIIKVATELFIQRGYEHTTIADILEAWGGSKGSLYYYFKSKEDVLNEVVCVIVEQEERRIRAVLADKYLSAIDALQLFLVTCLNKPKEISGLESYIYNSKNITLLYKVAKLYIEKSIPFLEAIVMQGISEGLFRTEYPSEAIEFALLIEEMIFKYPMFDCNEKQLYRKVMAFQSILECALDLERGSLHQLSSFCEQVIKTQRSKVHE